MALVGLQSPWHPSPSTEAFFHSSRSLFADLSRQSQLGNHISVPPERARLGSFINQQQHQVIERLEAKLDHFLQVEPFMPDDLGRARDKFQSVINSLKELPKCRLQDLEPLFQQIHHSMKFHSQHFAASFEETHPGGSPADPCYESQARASFQESDGTSHQCCFDLADQTLGTSSGSRPVVASRVKWQFPPAFDPVPYLKNPLLRAAYLDPETLRKPVNEWPKSIPGKVHCSKQELIALAERWDKLGACKIFDAKGIDWHECVGLFCVPKDEEFDRLIINPKAINSRMHTISEATKTLAPGCMLGLLHLEDDEVFRINADDLSDFYYTFIIPEKRALRSCFRLKFVPDELKHLTCFECKHAESEALLLSLNTMAMGDNLAVEIAQAAHQELLREHCGSMLPHETLRYRHPVPRGPFVELLAIDDHISLQKLPRKDYPHKPELRDSKVFKLAERAYKEVGLVQQEKKRKRNCLQSTILGCDFDGDVGIASAPRSRLVVLSLLTMRVVELGTCTPNLLSIILGCWIHALLFRRPLFSVLDAVFKDGQGRPRNSVFCLSRQSLNELQMLCILAPMAHSDLRVQYSTHIYTTDASPWGGAVCKAKIGCHATAELWRHSEQKGFYTKLQSPVSSILTEKGIESQGHLFGEEDHPDVVYLPNSPAPSLKEGILFDCIELFRGTGNWSKAHDAMGLSVHDGVDTDGRRLRCMDLSSFSVFREVSALALRGVVRDWHAGVVCKSFGTLRRPRVRSKEFPYGFNPSDPFTKYHNLLAQRTAVILMLAFSHGAFISVEQPGGSCLFHMHLYRVLVQRGCIITRFCFCGFGSAIMKPSKWLHNKPWLEDLACSCTCPFKDRHFVVQGTFTRESLAEFKSRCRPSCQAVYGTEPMLGQSVSSFSGAYPVQLVTRMASGSLRAKQGEVGRFSTESRRRSFSEVGLAPENFLPKNVSHEEPYPPRLWHEDPDWIAELCNSLPFTECFRYHFKRSGHINVNESRAYKSWIKSMAKSSPNSRFVGILDSRVTIGASAKGRSSSSSISRILQGSLAYILGGNLYPGCLHCRSQDNRADEPSRDKPIRPPTIELPLWLANLQRQDPRRFDLIREANRVPQIAARWLRLLLLLGGDIEPNPGPPKARRHEPLRSRGPMDLGVGFAPATADRMQKCLAAFLFWLSHECPSSHESILQNGEHIAAALRAYGMHCFESGLPRYLYVYAITAIQDRFPQYKSFMAPAWHIDKKWQQHEPGECRAVLPATAIRAALCIGALWQWFQWVGIVLIGFSAMLHPSEMLSLRRQDLVLPRDTAYDSSTMFVHVKDPKTSRFARRQHGRIDDARIIAVIDRLFSDLPLHEKLFTGTMNMFRRQWNAVMKKLNIPFRQEARGATPGVLRGSGATFLYHASEDIQWVAWRGRWSKQRTLEYYLQEVSAQLLVHQLPAGAKEILFAFDKSSWPVLCSLLSLRSSTSGVD